MNELRPTTFDEIIGNDDIKQCLKLAIRGAQDRNEAMQHTLFTGCPGTGKTTFACAISNEMGSNVIMGNGGQISSPKLMLPYIFKLKEQDILFIDEIHRIPSKVQETLYTAMEDYYVDLGKGGIKLDLPKFTLIGATTESGQILRPMYDRFIYKFELYLYDDFDLGIIIRNSAKKLGMSLTDGAVTGIIKRGRGTPRIVNSHLLWLRDHSGYSVSDVDVENAMKMMGIDRDGLTKNDHRYLNILRNYRDAVGLNTLVSALSMSKNVVENDIEPFLIRQNLIRKTSRGRILV